MDGPNYPSNSRQPQAPPQAKPPEDKNLTKVAAKAGTIKKKSISRQFSETFVGGDLKETARYVLMDVAVPSIRDLIADSAIQGIERLIFGQARQPRRHMGPVRPGPAPGRIQYQNYAVGQQPNPGMPSTPGAPMMPQRRRQRPAPEVTDFDDILIDNRTTAEVILERMGDVLSQYGSVSVADLYSLADMPTVHTDNNWGWTDLKGSHVSKNRGGGYLLNLPDPAAFQ